MKLRKAIYLVLLLSAALTASAASDKSYYFQRAEEAYQQKNYDQVIRFSEQGVKENPKDGYCWAMLAEIYSKRAYAEYAKSLEAADKALQYIKKDNYWRAFVTGLKGDVYYKIEDYAASKVAYREAMNIDKENNNYRLEYADVCFKTGDYAEGVEMYEQALDKDPSAAYGFAELGYGYYKLGRIKEAQQACRMAMTLTGDENYTAHHVLARIAMDEGRLAVACREEARAMALEDDGSTGISDSLVYLCRPLMDAAILNELQKVQTDANAHIHVAGYYNAVLDNVHMFEHVLKAEQYGVEHKMMLQWYAHVYQQLGEYNEAVSLLKQAMANDSLSEQHKGYYYGRIAQCYRENGDVDNAIGYSKLEIAADPEDGANYRMLGRTYLMKGDMKNALAYMDSAIVLATEYQMPTALFNRGEVKRRMGDEAGAQSDFREALSYRGNKNSDRSTFVYIEALLGNREVLDHYVDSLLAIPAFLTVTSSYQDIISCYALLQDKEATLKHLDAYFAAGFRGVPFIQNYFRLEWLREDPDFRALMAKWEAVRQDDLRRMKELTDQDSGVSGVTELPFTMDGGVCQVKCFINGLPLYFVFDTGAADITISSVEANFMLKNGYLTDADFLGKQNYVTATGEIHEGTIINLREVRVGDVVLNDVKASVVKSQRAPLLLGQSVFRRFGTLEVDNKNSIIRFTRQ